MVCKECKESGHVSKTCLSKFKEVQRVESDEECSICLSKTNKPKCKTKCGHYFHIRCLKEWLKTNVKCPLCRTVVNKGKEDILNMMMDVIREQIESLEEQYPTENFDQVQDIVFSYFENELLI